MAVPLHTESRDQKQIPAWEVWCLTTSIVLLWANFAPDSICLLSSSVLLGWEPIDIEPFLQLSLQILVYLEPQPQQSHPHWVIHLIHFDESQAQVVPSRLAFCGSPKLWSDYLKLNPRSMPSCGNAASRGRHFWKSTTNPCPPAEIRPSDCFQLWQISLQKIRSELR